MKIEGLLWKTLSIQKSELRFSLSLFLLYLLSGSFYAIGQIFSETVFLKAYGAEGLSKFFIYNGIALILGGIIYNSLLLRLSLKRGYVALILFFSGLILGASLLPFDELPWLPFYLFLGNYVITFFLDIHFFNYAFQYLSLRSSKRLLPLLMGGGKMGGILAGFLIFSHFYTDISNWGIKAWYLNGFLLILPIVLLGYLNKAPTQRYLPRRRLQEDMTVSEKLARSLRLSFSSPLFTYSLLAVFIMAVVNQIAEFYSARIFNSLFTEKQDLARFLSAYTLTADFITLAAQIFIASRIIQGLGVKRANYIYPSTFLGFIALLVFWPGLWGGILLRFFRKNLSLMLRTPLFNILLSAAPKERQTEFKSFLSGIISPLGMITGGALLLAIIRGNTALVGFAIAVSAGVLYLLLTGFQNRAYMEALRERLSGDFREDAETDLKVSEYAPFLRDHASAEGNLEFLELLFNERGIGEIAPVLTDHFSRLHPETRKNLLRLAPSLPREPRTKLLEKALRDRELTVRCLAYGPVHGLPYRERIGILPDTLPEGSKSERLVLEILRINKEKDFETLAEKSDEIMRHLTILRDEALKDREKIPEFLTFLQILQPSHYLDPLYEVSIRTRDRLCLEMLIPHAAHLIDRRALRILHALRSSPLGHLCNYIDLRGNFQEIQKLMLLDLRGGIPDRQMARIFRPDERARRLILKRLGGSRSYTRQSQYLNYLMSLEIKSPREMKGYINRTVERIEILTSETAAIPCLVRDGNGPAGIAARFLERVWRDEIELRKRLILKAISLITGADVDQAYDSTLFLRERDIINYILEYIETSEPGLRRTLSLFEEAGTTPLCPSPREDRIPLLPSPDSVRQSTRFAPGLAVFIRHCLSILAPKNGEPAAAQSPETRAKEALMLTTMEKMLFLKGNPLFQEMNLQDLLHIAHITQEYDIPAGKTLIQEGETGDELYIIIEGEVEITKQNRLISTLGSGSCIGELSIIDREPRSARAHTRTRTRILSILRKDFLLTLKENPTISINVMQVITQRLRHMLQDNIK